jgi:hypothetical protein
MSQDQIAMVRSQLVVLQDLLVISDGAEHAAAVIDATAERCHHQVKQDTSFN